MKKGAIQIQQIGRTNFKKKAWPPLEAILPKYRDRIDKASK
jgi:hypothetical protein